MWNYGVEGGRAWEFGVFHSLTVHVFVPCGPCPYIKSGVLHPTTLHYQSCFTLPIHVYIPILCISRTLYRLKSPAAIRAAVRCASSENCAKRMLYK